MQPITIITAFYDIGRSDWSSKYHRKTTYYFECFKRLCQLKNKIIVFSEEKFKPLFDEIISNQKSDLIVIYKEIFNENKGLLQKIKNAQKNLNKIGGLHDSGNPPEYWNPDYVLINFLKSEFCVSAINDVKNIGDIISWIDFGYLKKNEQLPKSRIWKYDFPDKINLWSIRDIPESLNLLELILSNEVYIQGCHMVAPKEKFFKLNELMKSQLDNYLSQNIIDDDQSMLLMSYLSNPKDFFIHKEKINHDDLGWFFIFQYYNFEQIKRKKINIKNEIKRFIVKQLTGSKRFINKLLTEIKRFIYKLMP